MATRTRSSPEFWEVKQRKQVFDLEQSLNKQVQEIHDAWEKWEFNAAHQLAKLTLEQKLASLPHIEDIPVPSNEYTKTKQIAPYSRLSHPFSFFRADRSEERRVGKECRSRW